MKFKPQFEEHGLKSTLRPNLQKGKRKNVMDKIRKRDWEDLTQNQRERITKRWMAPKNSSRIRKDTGCFDDNHPENPGFGTYEDDTMFKSRGVVDGSLKGKLIPKEVCTLSRGSFVESQNPVEFSQLMKELDKVCGDDLVVLVPQVTLLPALQHLPSGKSIWRIGQCGMGPNYNGNVFSMAACRHEKRCLSNVIEKAREGKLWWAVVTSVTSLKDGFNRDFKMKLDSVPHFLVSLHKVQKIVWTQKELYEVLLKMGGEETLGKKRNDRHRLGDLFIPTEIARKYAITKNIDDGNMDYWGLVENYNPLHRNNRHLVQSSYTYAESDRVIRDVWWSASRSRRMDVPMFHVGYHTSHPDHWKRAFTWASPKIHFFDERFGENGISPHGGLMSMEDFRRRISEQIELSVFAEVNYIRFHRLPITLPEDMELEYQEWRSGYNEKRRKARLDRRDRKRSSGEERMESILPKEKELWHMEVEKWAREMACTDEDEDEDERLKARPARRHLRKGSSGKERRKGSSGKEVLSEKEFSHMEFEVEDWKKEMECSDEDEEKDATYPGRSSRSDKHR